ncbi:hypothetical protein pdam_00010057 [Pocillopora damicornis]|uniref:WKF domain-containing protein n=1 Tax=Pocillopora damicornis TaxID=46731 RepID=A0A3M6TSS9_POCDA|nr:hypothetical protein pdam_00010057 [Pocillopora damicornis]
MEKGNSKEGRKEKKKAKKYEGHRDQKSVAMARKFSQSETLPKGQKRARDSDGENCQRDISSKEGKKIKKETVVERTEECNSTTDNCQSKGEQKERVSKGKLKPRERTQEPTSSEKCKLRNFGEEQLVSFGKEDKFRENRDQESLDKEKRKKNSRGNDNYSAQSEEERENRENSKGKHDKKLKKSTIVVGKKRTKKKPDDNAFFEEQKHYIFDTQSNEGLHEEMLETCEDAVKAEMNNEGKKKKKKSKQELQKESKSALHPAIDYLHTWFNNRQHWNFKKVRQVWLLKNMFDQEQISNENFGILLKYLEGLEGAAKEKTIKIAEQRLDSGEGLYMKTFMISDIVGNGHLLYL